MNYNFKKFESTGGKYETKISIPIVDRHSPEDIEGIVGIGVDKSSCFEIEKLLD